MSAQYSNNMPRIIGLGGRAGAGKTIVAAMLCSYYGYQLRSFAEQLKEAARLIYDLSTEQLYCDEKDQIDERYDLTPRTILQRLGTEVCREVYPATWIMALERRVNDENFWYVIDDVRFPNEVEAIKSWGGVVWKIVGRESEEVLANHISEQPLDIHTVIDNSGTKIQLKSVIEQLIEGGR